MVKVDLAATTQHNTTTTQRQRLSLEAALLPEWQRSLKILVYFESVPYHRGFYYAKYERVEEDGAVRDK